nr:MAG TPA: hypothetical protein [Caudoviricetes sp.]
MIRSIESNILLLKELKFQINTVLIKMIHMQKINSRGLERCKISDQKREELNRFVNG